MNAVPDACPLCGDACLGADLAPLLDPRLTWLWDQIASAADRRGDATMEAGALIVRAPDPPEERAAVGGLIGGAKVLKRGSKRRVDLAALTSRLRVRGERLTPGAVAAHVLGRPLAVRAAAASERVGIERQLIVRFGDAIARIPEGASARPDSDDAWQVFRRAGWVARLAATADPIRLLELATRTMAALPRDEGRADRRRLASDVCGDPHGLDGGTALGGLALAVLAAAKVIPPRLRPRVAWAMVGVDCDDVTGGLLSIGILPMDWVIPGASPVTLPPRVLAACRWPSPARRGEFVFVTENPSVASAAADLASSGVIRLLCTSGNPSAGEIRAIARLVTSGWSIAVRADFDEAGLRNVAAVLAGIPTAVPWRMGAEDYLASIGPAHTSGPAPFVRLPETSWDPELSRIMREKGVPAFEEALLPDLLDDLRRGRPHKTVLGG